MATVTKTTKPRLTPLPIAKGTTKDLLAKAETFGEGIDMGLVIKAVESRSSRRR